MLLTVCQPSVFFVVVFVFAFSVSLKRCCNTCFLGMTLDWKVSAFIMRTRVLDDKDKDMLLGGGDFTWEYDSMSDQGSVSVYWPSFQISPAEIHKSMFWGIYNVLLLIMLHHGVSVQKPPGDKFSPQGKFFIHGFVWSEKTYFYQYVLSSIWCKHCRNIADYFSSFIYPVPIIM